MVKNIVFLNLADMDPHGVAAKAVAGLKRKYPALSGLYSWFTGSHKVTQINLFGLMRQRTGGRPGPLNSGLTIGPPKILGFIRPILWGFDASVQERLEIRRLVNGADKVMLAAHGQVDNVTTVSYTGAFGSDQTVHITWRDLASLLHDLLDAGKTHKVSLIICYGARSARHTADHNGDLTANDIKSSLAYQVFKEVSQTRDVVITARTGAVSFNESTGASEVQTESAIDAELQERHMRDDLSRRQQLGTITQDDEMAMIMDIADVNTRTSGKRGKQGKFVYTYNRTEKVCTVYRKYGTERMEVLYQGAL